MNFVHFKRSLKIINPFTLTEIMTREEIFRLSAGNNYLNPLGHNLSAKLYIQN